ncbi:hypothetical protein M885DRAFT_559018 [Pelagophyceae sp. CCMP2097]|nr:hypothetical protein M885DRAFT_559018 [Pelagophyceae sp. CCMP2097]
MSWAAVQALWKDGAGVDAAALEAAFPAAAAAVAARDAVWTALDKNGGGTVSLAEFDAWVNSVSTAAEGAAPASRHKSTLYAFARPGCIRAFFAASRSAPASGARREDDAVVTRDELRFLLHATQCAVLARHAVDDIASADMDRAVVVARLGAVDRALAGAGAAALRDGDVPGDAKVSLDDFFDAVLGRLAVVVETPPALPPPPPARGELVRVVYCGVEVTLRDVGGGRAAPAAAPLQLDCGGLTITVSPIRRGQPPPAEARPNGAGAAVLVVCASCGIPANPVPESPRPRKPGNESLPPGWHRRWDNVKKKYYYTFADDQTKTTTWLHPLSQRAAKGRPYTLSSLA